MPSLAPASDEDCIMLRDAVLLQCGEILICKLSQVKNLINKHENSCYRVSSKKTNCRTTGKNNSFKDLTRSVLFSFYFQEGLPISGNRHEQFNGTSQ